ncbi:MAG: nucleotide sugar dehydrogenase [Gemmatimonadaceae bacterium]|nr:nucleotide sugar dehydrogenase [Gemmatimonadaceae bacterium]
MKVAVIGVGRVGLPLSLHFESLGMTVVGIDRDPRLLESLARREMPFHEEGCQELLTRSTRVRFTSAYADAHDADYVIVTVGTPVHQHIETDLSLVRQVVEGLLPILRTGQTIILRSTLAPGTTAYLKAYIELHSPWRIGQDIGLACCPERLAENAALRELSLLPQVIGCEDDFSREAACRLFASLGVKLLVTTYVSAELVKLFNNVSRYVNFAVANYLATIAAEHGQHIHELVHMSNEDYPRGVIPGPGFTAGTCLRKDFGMINERFAGTDLLLSAWKVNEYMPYHVVEHLSSQTSLHGQEVVVLGCTFKRNSDDTRDALTPKLIRYIERKVPSRILVCDPHVKDAVVDGYPNLAMDQCLPSADVVFIAVNHECFSAEAVLGHAKPGAWIVDLWNCLGTGQVVSRVAK